MHPATFAWAVVCCRDRDVAADVLQSVYLKVLDGRGQFEERSQFRTWLFAVVRNAACDHRRTRWWRRALSFDAQSVDREEEPQSAGSRLEAEEEIESIRNALSQLPPRQREIVHLVFYEDLTVADAAKVLGITVGAARQHYARAKESLRISLQVLLDRPNESQFR